jgi:hypothetical protein
MVWYVARTGKTINAYKILVGKLERKRPLERRRRFWGNNIKMNVKEIGVKM